MRLPMQASYAPVGPGGVVTTAMGGANALLQQMYQNQIAQAQARYAQPLQQGIAAQEFGAGQNALALGALSAPYAKAQVQNAMLQPGATQATIRLTDAETSNVRNTAQQVAPNSAATRYATDIQAYIHSHPNALWPTIVASVNRAWSDMGQAIPGNLGASAPPSSPNNDSNSTSPASIWKAPSSPTTTSTNGISPNVGTVPYQGGNVAYTSTKPYNGGTIYWVPSLNNWVG